MCKLSEVRSYYAIQDIYVDDAAVEIKDGNIFVTYCQREGSEIVGAVRLITSLGRMQAIRAAVTIAIAELATEAGLRLIG